MALSKTEHQSIVSPLIDFFMVGGATFVVFLIAYLPIWENMSADILYALGFWLIFVVNFPHFIHGYQLLYKDFPKKLMNEEAGRASRIRHLVAGVISPVVLALFLIFGALQPTTQMLGYGVNLMFFFVGWHYVKQGYGILMMLSVRKKVFYSQIEKNILLTNAYIVWFYSWIQLNYQFDDDVFHDIPFTMIDVSRDVLMVAKMLLVVWSIGALMVLVKKSDAHKSISVNGLTAYSCALYGWVMLANINPLALIFIPALHSLQYLLFVWKLAYEKTKDGLNKEKSGEAQNVFKAMLPFLLVGFSGGLMFFYWLPNGLDHSVIYNKDVFGPQLFMFMFMIFLNVHHYFIDFAIWRRENPELQYLFR